MQASRCRRTINSRPGRQQHLLLSPHKKKSCPRIDRAFHSSDRQHHQNHSMMMLPSLSSRPLVSLFVLVAVGQRLHNRTAAHAYECTINVINNSYMKLKLQTYNGGDKVCWVKYASFELPASQSKFARENRCDSGLCRECTNDVFILD